MSREPFFTRLAQYYNDVAKVLRGEANAAKIFPNAADIGSRREDVYSAFLKQHTPSKCNVFFGGFLFDEDGSESDQMDIIISTDTAPRYHFNNSEKSFCPVEGTLGIASVKSTLDKNELFKALKGISSIPPTRSLEGRLNPGIQIPNYDNWPVKIIYASKGSSGEKILKHTQDYYAKNSQIPITRRPDIIHVAGSYIIVKGRPEISLYSISKGTTEKIKEGDYQLIKSEPDLMAIAWVLHWLQQASAASSDIYFNYGWIINGILKSSLNLRLEKKLEV